MSSLGNSLFVIFLLLFIAGILAIIYVVENKRIRELEMNIVISDKLIDSVRHNTPMGKFLMNILEIIKLIVPAQSYAFYIYDIRNNEYNLQAASSSNENNGKVEPSYSGLLPYKKEKYIMPAVISNKKVPPGISLVKFGEVPLIFVPICGNKGLILIGPVSNIPAKKKDLLNQISRKLETIFETQLEIHENKNKIKQAASSVNAIRNIYHIFSDIKGILAIQLESAARSIKSDGGMFITKIDGVTKVEKIVGLEPQIQNALNSDYKTQALFFELTAGREFVILTKEDKEFFQIPPYFVAEETNRLLVIGMQSDGFYGVSVFWYKDFLNFKESQFLLIKSTLYEMMGLVKVHKNHQSVTIDILKTMARLLDNISKKTISYSELMYRYSYVLAQEMKLSIQEIEDIALAAYLSNIGIFGLSDRLLIKNGRYSEMEYKTMKLHADIGASIIEETIGNSRISSFIRHHHERCDGLGYPDRIRGEAIPMGSRIIAVVQTFLAKIQGREYRTGINFEDALNQLKATSGTQLDSKVIDAFINWFNKKEKAMKYNNSALGHCWDMRCSPESVCIGCPAYKNTSKNCWEFNGINCTEHGNTCGSCYIYTEYLYRMRMK